MSEEESREGKSLLDTGLRIRKEVLGEEYVRAAMAGVTEFAKPFQELVTEYCWGSIWSRPGLERRERSMINLAMLTALNRASELKIHVKGALRNGCTEEEIREVLMQATIYCGVPAGVEAFKVARQAISEFRESGDRS